MNVLIRPDASKKAGLGHVMRCLTLADALKSRGYQVKFWCEPCELIISRGFEVVPLFEICGGDLLIVDHYGLDIAWEKQQRQNFAKIMVIDDSSVRDHDCDFFLNQNLGAVSLEKDCKQMLGPQFALLPPIYGVLHDRVPLREGPVKRILVSLGGGDYEPLYAKIMQDFITLERSDIHMDLVIPGEHSLTSKHSNVKIHGRLSSLVELMVKADLAVGAAGTTSWERLCLGLPSLIISLADNQDGNLRELVERELALAYQGFPETLMDGLDAAWSTRCMKVVDGHGLERVLAVLMASPEMELKLRHAQREDESWILELANDPVTRSNSFSSALISPEEHKSWFKNRLRDFETCVFYIAETKDGIPVGQVRFDREQDKQWLIDYSLAPVFRGCGLGMKMLNLALKQLWGEYKDATVVGRVKVGNKASQRIFEKLLFSKKEMPGYFVYERKNCLSNTA